jgi:hypothetical protein
MLLLCTDTACLHLCHVWHVCPVCHMWHVSRVSCVLVQGPPPQLEAECGGRHFSRGMREVVASCLNKDPAKRPTAKQLLSKG